MLYDEHSRPAPDSGRPSPLSLKEEHVSQSVGVGNGNGNRAPNPDSLYEQSPTFQMAQQQLDVVADQTDQDRGVLERLSKPKRALIVSVPIRMDDGHTEVFTGYRVQHSLTTGPSK